MQPAGGPNRTATMTNPTAVSSGGSTVSKLPLGENLTEFWERLVETPAASRKSGKGPTGVKGLSRGQLGSAGKLASGAQQNIEQIKSFTASYVDKCWKDFVKLFPEAFAANGSLATKAPSVVFLPTEAEFGKVFKGRTSGVVGFVNPDVPSLFYVNTVELIKNATRYGPEFVKTFFSHELIHNLTVPFILRSNSDITGKTASYGGVKEDLQLTFRFDIRKTPEIKESFDIRTLIMEFAAEHFSSKATGIPSFSASYTPVRATGKKLLEVVGEDVFRKAVLANDPGAYRKVVEAAKTLQRQNTRTNLDDQKNEAVADVRAAQAATPFGTPLTPATLEKLYFRYWREDFLYGNLQEESPVQIKNFDFRLLHAVDAHLKSRGAVADPLSETSQRDITAAIRAVWPLLK